MAEVKVQKIRDMQIPVTVEFGRYLSLFCHVERANEDLLNLWCPGCRMRVSEKWRNSNPRHC
jgi:hypothetical protein